MSTINRADNTITFRSGEIYPLTAQWLQSYLVCSKCKKPVSDAVAELAADRSETPICSDCRLHPMACCSKAVPFNCTCAYSYECPDHGVKHVGTHD